MQTNNLPVPSISTKNSEASQRSRFTKEEDELLKKLMNSQSQPKWSEIARFFNNRTARQCRERYNNYLRPEIVNGPWSSEEDYLLVQLFEKYGPKWSLISQNFNARSAVNVKNHYATLSSQKNKQNGFNDKSPKTVNQTIKPVIFEVPMITTQEKKEKKEKEDLNSCLNYDYLVEDKTDFLFEEDNLENILSNIEISEDIWSLPETTNYEEELFIF